MEQLQWRPSASIDNLIKRAHFIKQIRQFFYERGVLEVETPLMGSHGVTDPYIDSFEVMHFHHKKYLQTSPEYYMKRLLCAGAPDIFQLSKVFRAEPQGQYHNPEFTMLEWYRKGWSYAQLMEEVEALVILIMGKVAVHRITYQALFQQILSICPLSASLEALKQLALDEGVSLVGELTHKDAWLHLLMSHCIEPRLKQMGGAWLISQFPASQAALAKTEGAVARRFELYIDGVEIANGFEELLDASEQRHRFEQDNKLRQALNLPEMPLDERFLSALEHGLPACSGVALGIDRLLMRALDEVAIEKIMSFASRVS